MKSALILASVLVAMAAPSAVEDSRFSLTVTASGLT
jgi:hypothetical protein